MFTPARPKTHIGGGLSLLERMYYATVRAIRSGHQNAVVALAQNIVQALVILLMFYLMFQILGQRHSPLRGNFMLYILSGIFLYMTHVKTVTAISGAEGATSAMMQHAPMNTAIAIVSAALSTLYIQFLTILVILFVYHVAFSPIEIEDPVGAFGMLLLAWAYGVGVGMVFMSLKPWFPKFTMIARTIYTRANMIASGKMFVANALSYGMLKMFDWNPLFHAIDQSRGFVFMNYFPRFSSISYAVYVTLVLLAFGLMAEFFTRKHVSLSWHRR
ncbi:ABC transporter permease [Ostreiculturibacter nitratireducens]|uniref:ABC transporter permease n=1 Tax=Ostreiculturibacter nitratireducens TaxID=3075226 RepID=UPI0031B56E07